MSDRATEVEQMVREERGTAGQTVEDVPRPKLQQSLHLAVTQG
jgi:hypothetical protein